MLDQTIGLSAITIFEFATFRLLCFSKVVKVILRIVLVAVFLTFGFQPRAVVFGSSGLTKIQVLHTHEGGHHHHHHSDLVQVSQRHDSKQDTPGIDFNGQHPKTGDTHTHDVFVTGVQPDLAQSTQVFNVNFQVLMKFPIPTNLIAPFGQFIGSIFRPPISV